MSELSTEDYIVQGFRSGAPIDLLAARFKKTEAEIVAILARFLSKEANPHG